MTMNNKNEGRLGSVLAKLSSYKHRPKARSGLFSRTISIYTRGGILQLKGANFQAAADGKNVSITMGSENTIKLPIASKEEGEYLLRRIYKASEPIYAKLIRYSIWFVLLCVLLSMIQITDAPTDVTAEGPAATPQIDEGALIQNYELGLPPQPFSD